MKYPKVEYFKILKLVFLNTQISILKYSNNLISFINLKAY